MTSECLPNPTNFNIPTQISFELSAFEASISKSGIKRKDKGSGGKDKVEVGMESLSWRPPLKVLICIRTNGRDVALFQATQATQMGLTSLCAEGGKG